MWLCEHRPDIDDVVKVVMKKACELDPMPLHFDDVHPKELMWLTEDQDRRLYVGEAVSRVQ